IRSFDSRKALGLLAYLARHDQPIDRAQLASLFWADKSEARGRRNLSRELCTLTALLPGCFEASYHSVQWAPGVTAWVHTAAFPALTNAPEPSLGPGGVGRNGVPANITDLGNQWFFRHLPTDLDPSKLAEAVALYRGE